jgi:hypothetical protein
MLLPIKAPARFASYTRGPRRPGSCYHLAGQFVFRHAKEPGIELVHGVVTRNCTTPPAMGHGWVEIPLEGGVVVYDATARRFYPRDNYYEHFGVRKTMRYTPQQAGDAGLAAGGNWGPWDESVLIPAA